MAKKPNITTIASGYYSRLKLNENFENLQDAFNNTLSLDGSTPNAMQADLDLNNKDILNAQEISTNGLRIDGVLVGSSDIAAAGANMYTDSYTGDGSTVAYTMSYQPFVKDNTQVYIDGVYQAKDGYSISGTTLTFSEAPPLNSDIEIVVARSLDTLSGDADIIQYNQGDSGAVDNTVGDKLREFVSVKDFGAVGDGVTDDTAAIQAALDTGNSVIFPNASYVVSSDLSLYSNTVVDLNGSIIKGDGFLLSGISDVVLKNGRIENNGSTYPQALEINNGSTNISLETLTAYQVQTGFYFNGTGSTIKNIITRNLRVDQCKASPYFHYNTYNVQHSNISTYNAQWGFNMVSLNKHTQVVNAHFVLGASSTTPTGDDTWYNETPEHGIYCHNSFDCQFVNLHTDGWGRGSGNSGVKVRNFDTFKISNGVVENAHIGAGLFIQSGSTRNYLRNVVIENVLFKDNASDIFINDYVLGGDEIEVKFVSCDFKNRQEFNRGAGSADSVLEINSCNFHLGVSLIGSWSGSTVFTGCVFHTATDQALTVSGSSVQIDNCTFFDWNTDGNATGGGGADELPPACISGQNVDDIRIINCNFKQDNKRRAAFYGSTAGACGNIQIVNCFGGGDVSAFQSGGATDIYMSNCTNYDDTINPNTNTLKSAGNSIKLNNDGTVTVY